MLGRSLGPYRILEPLGAGGMAEVYLAEDTRLGRKVAVKVLPAEFASDSARLARFEQEARAAAALNHPHIAAVFDIGVAEVSRDPDGSEPAAPTHYMVQEYLEGQTLRERLGQGPLSLTKALDLATEIAEALSAAHAAGIVHRDLKPENVFVTREGHSKVLDFGLAKLTEPSDRDLPRDDEQTRSPTPLLTTAGQMMGTAGYMAPEQIQGDGDTDHRADVFAFGCLFQELLCGKRPFAGRDAVETLHRILHEPPEKLPTGRRFPPQLQWVLDKCLAKEPDQRYQHTDELAVRLKHLRRQIDSGTLATEAVPAAAPPARRRPRWLAGIGFGLAGLLVGFFARGVVGGGLGPKAERPPHIARFAIELPSGSQVALGGQPPGAVAISKDGSRIAYAVNLGGRTQIYLRALDDLEPRPIPGTEGGQGPFFSPRGDWLGFYADGRLESVSLGGGAPDVLAEVSAHRGATATDDGQVVYSPSINSGLWTVPASGGTPRELTVVDAEAGEYSHRWPFVLPDGDTVLFVIDRGGSFDEADIGVLSLESGQRKVLLEGGSYPLYSQTGHLLFARQGTILAVAFDEKRLEVTGRPTLVVSGVATQQDTGAAHFALSAGGVLVLVPGGAQTNERTLQLVDRRGSMRPIAGLPLRAYQQPSLSPDGKWLAVNVVEATHDLWLTEIARGTLTRLTFRGDNHSPVWSPDGRRVAFSSERGGPSQLFWIDADGSGGEEELATGEHSKVPTSFSPDGKLLAYVEVHPATRGDIWMLSMETPREAVPFLDSEYDEREAVFSPDGSSLAYVSNESGRYEVYVQPFPGPGRKLQISVDGGGQPTWSRDGSRVFYRNGDRMMEVPMAARGLSAEPPRELFDERFEAGYVYNPRIYDVAADGNGFVMAKGETQAAADRLHVVLDWQQELIRLLSPRP